MPALACESSLTLPCCLVNASSWSWIAKYSQIWVHTGELLCLWSSSHYPQQSLTRLILHRLQHLAHHFTLSWEGQDFSILLWYCFSPRSKGLYKTEGSQESDSPNLSRLSSLQIIITMNRCKNPDNRSPVSKGLCPNQLAMQVQHRKQLVPWGFASARNNHLISKAPHWPRPHTTLKAKI